MLDSIENGLTNRPTFRRTGNENLKHAFSIRPHNAKALTMRTRHIVDGDGENL